MGRLLSSATSAPDASTSEVAVPYAEYPGAMLSVFTSNVSSGFYVFQVKVTFSLLILSNQIVNI